MSLFRPTFVAFIIALFILLEASGANAQIRWDTLEPIAKGDAILPFLNDWQQKVVSNYDKRGVATAQFASWFELPFPSLKKLFPGDRFFTTSWSELPAPGKEKQAVGLAYGMECTLVFSTDGKLIAQLDHSGNYDSFGDFLAARKVSIRCSEDAVAVWNAFCDIHQKRWQSYPVIKVSDTNWHLGDTTIERFHYYYEVLLDEKDLVKSAALHADEIGTPLP